LPRLTLHPTLSDIVNCILLAGLDTIPLRTVNLSDTEVLEILEFASVLSVY
jgi:hypothetical protein